MPTRRARVMTSPVAGLLLELGVDLTRYEGEALAVTSPADGALMATLKVDSLADVAQKIALSTKAFAAWRVVPAPVRGELVRLFGQELRDHKAELAELVTLECGKILTEGLGEVQEMIDICDFAVGLSRQLYGLTIASERPEHVMQENWLPLGVVGVISAFNFPVAVWAWNAALALVCGNPVVWKPSEKTPLTALACQALFEKAVKKFAHAVPEGLSQLVIGGADIGNALVESPHVPLISATGSTRMGRIVGPKVAARFGRSLLELGGNNAILLAPSADSDIALPSILFGAVGTCGQRCTSTRRLFVHESQHAVVLEKLKKAYHTIADHKIGHPLQEGTLIGPLIDKQAFDAMQTALAHAKAQGGTVWGGERVQRELGEGAYYVQPALVAMPSQTAVVREEVFAPILYVMAYENLQQAMAWHNDVPQGLSSAIFTQDVREAEWFKRESDCGIANVNIGTSGAEIGGAFGGEKETGGGRESGSDSWKVYMRRQTSTTYYGYAKPVLAQGVKFE